jgi:hypothetical protein
MKNHYCILCGFEIPFASTRPNFCPECRAPQNTTASRASAPAPAPVKRQPIYKEEEFENEGIADVNVDKLISSLVPKNTFADSGAVNMKDVLGTASPSEEVFVRPAKTEDEFRAWKAKQEQRHTVIHIKEEES